MKNILAATFALLTLTATVVRAQTPLPKPRTVTYSAKDRRPVCVVRLPLAHDSAHAAPLVVVIPAAGKKPADAIKADDWGKVADRWGIVLLAPAARDRNAIVSSLDVARQHLRFDAARVYVYGDPQDIPHDLPDVAAWAARARGVKASQAWSEFERRTRPGVAFAQHRITLLITGLSSNQGQVAVSLWNRGADFGEDDKNAVASAVAPIAGGQATVTFAVREPGDYAALVLHDRNRNGKMDTSLGFPLEGFGASGNPPVRMSAPGWDECRFAVAASDRERRIVVKAVYLTGE